MQPLVSILVPVYNCEPFLDECISSIINQDYPNLQIVLGNDGSTDGSLDILKKYEKTDSRIEIFSRENKGVATTRNDLLDRIKGDYFLFVDADDWIEPNMISYLLTLSKEYNADIAACSLVRDNAPSKDELKVWDQCEAVKKFLFHKELSGSLCNKLICTRLLHKEPDSSTPSKRFNPEIYYGEDALFTWGLLQHLNTLAISDKQLYHYRVNANSISHSLYGESKKSSHSVWNIIYNDTKNNWPTYTQIALNSFTIADFWLLYFAAKDKVKIDKDLKSYKSNLKSNLKNLMNSDQISWNKKLFACALSLNYNIAKTLINLIKA